VSRKKSALDTLSAAEKGQLLDERLTARPDLRELAESCAAQRMSAGDSSAVADDVEQALRGLDIEELNSRAGCVRGVGYVHPAEAADEILDEALQPFLDDLQRRAELGMIPAAGELAVGILRGRYGCRDSAPESLLEYSPGLRARAPVARDRSMREARRRPARHRTPRPHASLEQRADPRRPNMKNC